MSPQHQNPRPSASKSLISRCLAWLLIGGLLAMGLAPTPISYFPLFPSFPPSPSAAPAAGAFAPGRVLARWREPAGRAPLETWLTAQGWQVLQTIEPLNTAVVQAPVGQELAAVAALQKNPAVAHAELDYIAYALAGPPPAAAIPAYTGLQPDDTYWEQQWAPRRIQAPLAWQVNTGAASVIVGVVDSGVDLGHPEFAGRLLPGYDYVNGDAQPQDDFGHGTHIAGVIAAAGDNDRGVAGLAWGARLLPVKVLDNRGSGSASNVALGVLYAYNQGASIINLSLALSGPSSTLHSAIQTAYNGGAAIVGAVGNESIAGQPPAPVRYPAAYPEVIAVAAANHWDEVAAYSNGGLEVDLAAPGGESSDAIISTSLGGGYALLYGTSIAAPYVSGLAALMRSTAPQASNLTLTGVLRNTADKVGSTPYVQGRNDRLGYGRVNAASALRQALAPALTFSAPSLQLLGEAGGALPTASVVLENASSQPLTWQLTEIGAEWLDVDLPWSGSLAYPAAATLRVRLGSALPAGRYSATIRLRSTALGGQQSNYTLPVTVAMAEQLHEQFLPTVGTGHVLPHWVDASLGGISIGLGDNGAQAIGLPFAFPLYGRAHSQVWVHANGFLSFGQSYGGDAYASNGCIPGIAPPNGAVYALWDDLDPSAGGQVYFNAASSEFFVVEWRNVPRRGGSAGNTFQVILWSDGRVQLQYQAVDLPSSATVGFESWDASFGWQVACNGSGSPPAGGQAWLFSTALP